MPTTKQKYVLSHRHQLIDLNKTFKNFKLQFQVVATEPNTDFHAIVLNQEQLDGTTDLQNVEMKLAKGRIGGTIVADNDKYQNYFLVLKSVQAQDNVEVEVSTTLEEVEPKAVAAPPPEKDEKEMYTPAAPEDTTPAPTKTWYKKPWFWVLLLALVLGGAYYYFYIYQHSSTASLDPPTPAAPAAVLPVELFSEIPSCADPLLVSEAPVQQVVMETSTATAPRSSKKATSKQTLYTKLSEIA